MVGAGGRKGAIVVPLLAYCRRVDLGNLTFADYTVPQWPRNTKMKSSIVLAAHFLSLVAGRAKMGARCACTEALPGCRQLLPAAAGARTGKVVRCPQAVWIHRAHRSAGLVRAPQRVERQPRASADDLVEFGIEQTERGPAAADVAVIGHDAQTGAATIAARAVNHSP